MKRMFSVFLLITVWLLVTPFLQAQSHVDKVLKDEITSDLKENILSFWEILPEAFMVHWDVTVPR